MPPTPTGFSPTAPLIPPSAAAGAAPAPSAPGQTIQASDGTQLDAGVVNLARAIRLQESGNNYTKTGDAGTSAGAYQFNNGDTPIPKGGVPANFQTWAKQYGLDPTDFSPVNQDKVAYARLKDLKDQGLTPEQVAAVWNGGMGVKDDWQNHKGTATINGKQVAYDTPAYVSKVINTFQALKSGQTPVPSGGSAPAPSQGTNPSLLGSAASAIGQGAFSLFKGITSPLVTMLARPVQAVAELAGASPEQVNAFSAKVPIYGENGALNVPQNGSDVMKDVGRGVETAALGLGPVAGGAAFGAGNAVEQGNSPLSLNTAAQAALGAVGGKVLDVAAPYLAKSASIVAPKVVKNAFGAIAERAAPAAQAVGDFMDRTKILPDAASSAINKGADFVNNAPSGAFNAIRRQYGSAAGGTPAEIRAATLSDVGKALGNTGKKSAGSFVGDTSRQLSGLETLHDMAPGLKVKDEVGASIPYDPTTATLPQHVEALDQAKTDIYSQIEKHLTSATKGGVQVDVDPTIARLQAIADDVGRTSAARSRAQTLISDIKQLRTPSQVNSYLQDLNVGIKGIITGGSANIERGVDLEATQELNKALDKTVIDLKTGGAPIRDLKNKYSSLKSIESGLVTKAQQMSRKVGSGIADYINPFNLADALEVFHSPLTAAKGAFRAAMLEKAKLTRDPERILNDVFKNIAAYKGTVAPAPRSVFGRPSPIPALSGGLVRSVFGGSRNPQPPSDGSESMP